MACGAGAGLIQWRRRGGAAMTKLTLLSEAQMRRIVESRALQPRSEGSSSPTIDRSASDTAPRPTQPPGGSLKSENKRFGN